MTTLYIANKNYSSWSLRAWLLMTELGLPFEEKLIPFGDPTAWNAFRAEGGSGKVPALQDGSLHVWDSLAIIDHLAECHSEVWPADPAARAWARSVCAEMHSGFPALRELCSMNTFWKSVPMWSAWTGTNSGLSSVGRTATARKSVMGSP